MAEFVASLQVALPLAMDREAFHDETNRAELDAALARLQQGAVTLEGHGERQDAGFAHLSHSLARDAAEITWRLGHQRAEEARFLLTELVDHCVACHSRLPGPQASQLGRSLIESVDLDRLARDDRIRLEIATRQFGRALDDIEALFREELIHPTQLDLAGFLVDYLRVAVRVTGELPRAARFLDDWRAGQALPPYLDRLVATWVEALGRLDTRSPPGQELAVARSLAEEAAGLRRFPSDRRSLVHDLVVSSLLHRALARGDLPKTSEAEAYYLLGLAELYAEHTSWLAAPESYLEAAVRAAPGSPIAREAYLALEEDTLAGYSGSAGTYLPPAVETWLDELRGLAGL
jgi:hypothetical protein